MADNFSYTTEYTLDKAHFTECFDESVTASPLLVRYAKALVLMGFGFLMLYATSIDAYIASFILVLGFIDALGVYYRRAWWVARQVISKAAGSTITLTIDETAITSQSVHVETSILWAEVETLKQTQQGWLVTGKAGKSYVSSSSLSAEAMAFLSLKAAALNA